MTHDPDLIQIVADGLQDRHDMDTPWASYAEGALDALCAARPDVAALLRGDAVAVPRKATEEMLDATNGFPVGCCSISTSDAAELWGDMLAASPWAKEDKP